MSRAKNQSKERTFLFATAHPRRHTPCIGGVAREAAVRDTAAHGYTNLPVVRNKQRRQEMGAQSCRDAALSLSHLPTLLHPDIAKEETSTFEGINAGSPLGSMRTCLGRLKGRSRCSSRSAAKLAGAVRLFVWHDNRRQRLINAIPAYRSTLPLLF